MKQISKILGPVALAAAAFLPQHALAIAGVTYDASAQYLGAYTYVGVLNPTLLETSNINHAAFVPTGSPQTDYWVFDLNPTGNTSASLTFQPDNTGGLSFLSISLFYTSPIGYPSTSGTCNLDGFNKAALCAPVPVLGAQVPTTNVLNGGSNGEFASAKTQPNFLAAGRYVAAVVYTSSAAQASYGGAIATNQIPEPGSLALVGAALLGAAVSLRKRKSA